MATMQRLNALDGPVANLPSELERPIEAAPSFEEEEDTDEEDYDWVIRSNGSVRAYCSGCRRKCEKCPICEKDYDDPEDENDESVLSDSDLEYDSDDDLSHRHKRRRGRDARNDDVTGTGSEESEDSESSEDEDDENATGSKQ